MKMKEYQDSTKIIFDKYMSKVAIFVVGAISIIVPYIQINRGREVDYIEIILFFLGVSAVMFVYFFLVRWIFVYLPPKLFGSKSTKSDSDKE